MGSFIIVSYFTKGTLYEKEAMGLISSCKHLGIEHDIVPVKNLGSWEKNCCRKPSFLLAKLKEHKKPIIWVDSDAVFWQKPDLFNELTSDLAIRIDEDRAKDHPSRVLGGTIYVSYSACAIKLMRMWQAECKRRLKEKKEGEVWDQACLRDLLQEGKLPLKLEKLPLGYCRIFDWPRDYMSDEETVILHFQASRLYKNFINGEVASFLFLDNYDSEELKALRYRYLFRA